MISAAGDRARDLVPRRFRKDYAHAVATVDAYRRGDDQLRAGMAATKILNLELLR